MSQSFCCFLHQMQARQQPEQTLVDSPDVRRIPRMASFPGDRKGGGRETGVTRHPAGKGTARESLDLPRRLP